ncbi:MAG TPA: hypothetical protein ENK24_05530 [Anaerolineae bacterium]|nr:hypothetical protein [Anaerolineae bacterium]
MKTYLILLSLFILSIFALPVLAQDPQSDVDLDAVNAVARKMNCPTCQSLNLADCRTQTCNQWREQIADLLASGMTQDEVLDWYIARYGEEVLQEPPKHGVGLYVWILPIIGFLVGAGWLAYILKKWSANQPEVAVVEIEAAPEAKIAAPEDDYLKRVEQDLQDL